MEKLNAVAAQMSLAYKYDVDTKTETVEIPSTVTDTLTHALSGISGTSYKDWTTTGASSAVYACNSCGNTGNYIQLRSSNSNAGIVTTKSEGTIKSITIKWNSKTTSTSAAIDIYGSNTPYTSPNNLYNNNTQGTKIDSIVNDGLSTTLEIGDDSEYTYIGIRSKSGAVYLDSIEITWNTGAGAGETEEKTTTTYSKSEFALRCGVDATLTTIENVESVESYGIKVSAGGKSVLYTDEAISWTVDKESGICYVVISLGDIINDLEKLGTEFTVQAYVVVDSTTYVSEQTKTYSVATMVAEYYGMGINEVKGLYDYLVEKNLV